MNPTIQAFGYPNTLIKEFARWVVLLRPNQVTIGSLIIASKSEATHFGQLKSADWSEFANVCTYAEDLIYQKFKAEKFNYLALMMKDPNVHFHFIPRYSKPIVVGGVEYKDADWPLKTELERIEISPRVFDQLKNVLLEDGK